MISELTWVRDPDWDSRFGGIEAVDATFDATFEVAAEDVVDDARVETERRRRCGVKMVLRA